MKKATVQLVGWLGNQLHGYAFSRALQHESNLCVFLDSESGFWSDPYGREFLLTFFLNAKINLKRMPRTVLAKLLFRMGVRLGKWISRALPLCLRPIVSESRPCRYEPDLFNTRYTIGPYFIGYWASYRYYENISSELKKELAPPIPVDEKSLEFLEEIRNSESCFVHWRSYKEETGVEHPNMDNYYLLAIEYICSKYPLVKFFIFSDDPTCARKKIISISHQAVIIDNLNAVGNRQSLADFFLMYSCNHAIIGDSTFSWWAAWLSDNSLKSVVAPGGLSPWGKDWIPPHWTVFNA